jgi:hypothetical protein
MIIDADAHVEESQAMFDRLDKEYYDRRPLPVRFDEDTVFGKYNAVWLIEGKTSQDPVTTGLVDSLTRPGGISRGSPDSPEN